MNIVNLQVQNFKRLSAVNITPSGDLVVIGGKNGAGKSSVLDSIMGAIAGGNNLPDKPLKEGAQTGYITVDVGEFTITRHFKRREDKSVTTTLEIKNANGFKSDSPQKLLNSLYGNMTFDPLHFSRLKPKEQIDTLKELVKIDFSDIDKNKSEIYNERTDISRKLDEKTAQLNSLVFTLNLGIDELSISDLMDDLLKIESSNVTHEKLLLESKAVCDERLQKQIKIKEAETEIERLRMMISDFRLQEAILFDTNEKLEESIKNNPLQDTQELKEKIKNAESINQKIRENLKYTNLTDEINLLSDDKFKKTEILKSIEEEKIRIMESANFPIDGLGFDENGIIMRGIPFDQASSAEKLKISVAMGVALNPKLKIMQIRDGSLLDEDSLKIIEELAVQSGTQIWIERVGEGQECSIIISDGYVKGDDNFI